MGSPSTVLFVFIVCTHSKEKAYPVRLQVFILALYESRSKKSSFLSLERKFTSGIGPQAVQIQRIKSNIGASGGAGIDGTLSAAPTTLMNLTTPTGVMILINFDNLKVVTILIDLTFVIASDIVIDFLCHLMCSCKWAFFGGVCGAINFCTL